tara:strand:+ start:197 stop:406 length:210 start_codon:yes stop_codon:yes gene_type:complete
MLTILHLQQHHQVMLDQLIQFKVLMVVEVDKVDVMVQVVVVEHLLLEDKVDHLVVELLLVQVGQVKQIL